MSRKQKNMLSISWNLDLTYSRSNEPIFYLPCGGSLYRESTVYRFLQVVRTMFLHKLEIL